VLLRHRVVGRTVGWLGRYHRLNRDYERLAKTGETMVYPACFASSSLAWESFD